MRVARTIAEARAFRAATQGTLGLVPTMGAFHAGHASLFAAARDECDAVVVSLFVNPAQFGEEADLLAYPRDEEHDLAMAAEAGVDLAFCPRRARSIPRGSRRGST